MIDEKTQQAFYEFFLFVAGLVLGITLGMMVAARWNVSIGTPAQSKAPLRQPKEEFYNELTTPHQQVLNASPNH